eukprot:GGOE01007450.1.p1 GENE.GGOE01007450.1~~GGOE01007450.1.p1  ORF type:complete len:224 (-),score=51.71 GGOE01007450.1:1391-2014(-)
MPADSAPVVAPLAFASGDEKPAKKTKAKRYPRPNVCLDYLKGQCGAKRFQCKYQHPDLVGLHHQLDEVQSGAEKEVCEVWALTGRCKFGSKCNKLHPATHQAAATPANPEARKGKGDGAEAQPVDAEIEFRAFADSLLTPFNGVDIDPVDHSEAPVAAEEVSHDPDVMDLTGAKDAGLEAVLENAAANFDRIFLDILSDLHITAMSM